MLFIFQKNYFLKHRKISNFFCRLFFSKKKKREKKCKNVFHLNSVLKIKLYRFDDLFVIYNIFSKRFRKKSKENRSFEFEAELKDTNLLNSTIRNVVVFTTGN